MSYLLAIYFREIHVCLYCCLVVSFLPGGGAPLAVQRCRACRSASVVVLYGYRFDVAGWDGGTFEVQSELLGKLLGTLAVAVWLLSFLFVS